MLVTNLDNILLLFILHTGSVQLGRTAAIPIVTCTFAKQ